MLLANTCSCSVVPVFESSERLRAELAGENLCGLGRAELCDRVKTMAATRAGLAAFEARLCRAIDELNDSGPDGASVLRTVGRCSSRRAAASAVLTSGLAELPITEAALAQGQINGEHAATLARAAAKVSAGRADSELVERARSCPADVFAKEVRDWVAANSDPADGEEELAAQRSLRQAAFWTDHDGLRCMLAKFDPIVGKQIEKRVQQRYDEFWREDGGRNGVPPDVRSREQRMADALAEVMLEHTTQATTGRPHPKAQLIVTADLTRLSLDDPSGVANLIGHGAIPQHVLERLACTAEIAGVLFNGEGRPIWVGRDHRSATVAQWRALIARDKGCVGCAADASRCEAHHIVAWLDRGTTDITNLALVCSRCHHDLHDRGATLSTDTEGRFHIEYRAGPKASASSTSSPTTRYLPPPPMVGADPVLDPIS